MKKGYKTLEFLREKSVWCSVLSDDTGFYLVVDTNMILILSVLTVQTKGLSSR